MRAQELFKRIWHNFRLDPAMDFNQYSALCDAPAQPQTFQLLHTFTGGGDGRAPLTAMTLDRGGNLYGTTSTTLFKMTHTASGWVLNTIYTFHGPDGNGPLSPLIFGPDGALYGTTVGGGVSGDGVVFRVKPPANFCHAVSCPWTENVLYYFGGGTDSLSPQGPIIFDSSGNLYGTNYGSYIASKNEPPGGPGGGAAWKLVHTGNSWQINVLHGFTGVGGDGVHPGGGVIFDHQGNLYATTQFGGDSNLGTVFRLTNSGSGWTENTVYNFEGQEGAPAAGLISDAAGNMYGDTFVGAYAFELTPSGGGWNFANLYQITMASGPQSNLTLDSQGNLYGANLTGGPHGKGNIFKLTHSNGTWSFTDLYDFTGGSDGYEPIGGVIVDSSGNIYGTTAGGGANGFGTVWMITP
jgi:uncharacterized repeat protein (TIGR03803 family)